VLQMKKRVLNFDIKAPELCLSVALYMEKKIWILKNKDPLNPVHLNSNILPRFGRALAKVRTRHSARLRKQACNLIKENIRKYRTVKRNTRHDRLMMKCENLEPIFECLA